MNREILFRGKRADNGEWVYGSFVPDALEIVKGAKCLDGFIRNYDAENGDILMHEVDRESVGQYTGLTDRNGKKIFEGDVVKCYSREDVENCVVIFEKGEFRLVPTRIYKDYQEGCGYYAIRCFVKIIIGNIHDNPDLLGGENNV